LGIVDSVEGADSALALEDELVAGTGEGADSTSVLGVSSSTDALTVRDNLVGTTTVAVTVGVQQLVSLALAGAEVALEGLAGRTGAAIVTVVDHGSGAD
jgi:hypothetical protein